MSHDTTKLNVYFVYRGFSHTRVQDLVSHNSKSAA